MNLLYATIFFILLCSSTIRLSLAYTIPTDFDYLECSPDRELCEYWLVVQEKLTMIHDGVLVYSHNGTLIKYDEFPNNYTTKVSRVCFKP